MADEDRPLIKKVRIPNAEYYRPSTVPGGVMYDPRYLPPGYFPNSWCHMDDLVEVYYQRADTQPAPAVEPVKAEEPKKPAEPAPAEEEGQDETENEEEAPRAPASTPSRTSRLERRKARGGK